MFRMNLVHHHFYPEDGLSMFLRNAGTHLPGYTVSTYKTAI
jgi:hypothetical protein